MVLKARVTYSLALDQSWTNFLDFNKVCPMSNTLLGVGYGLTCLADSLMDSGLEARVTATVRAKRALPAPIPLQPVIN
jgi:hypothetical protein